MVYITGKRLSAGVVFSGGEWSWIVISAV